MAEGKTKPRALKSKTKAKAKPATALVSRPSKSVTTKRPAVKVTPRAVKKSLATKATAPRNKKRPSAALPKTKVVAAEQFEPSRPLAPLPKPIELTPQLSYSYRAKVERRTTAAPHRLSLRHNLFTILTLTFVGFCALLLVASYANITFQYIEIYGTHESSLLKPVSLTERSFALDAGTFTVKYPESYAVTATSAEAINWEYSAEPSNTVGLRVHKNESDNVFTWLQNNQPEYGAAKVIAPTAAVESVNGILVQAQNAEGADVYVVYWPYQKNLAEKYIIELMLTVDDSGVTTERLVSDLELFVQGVEISE